MFCNKCGKELPDNSVFCLYCGAALPLPKEKTPGLEPRTGETGPGIPAATRQDTPVQATVRFPAPQETIQEPPPYPAAVSPDSSVKTADDGIKGSSVPPSGPPPGPDPVATPGRGKSYAAPPLPLVTWVVTAIIATVLLSLWWPAGFSLLTPLVLLTGGLVVLAGITGGKIRRILGAAGAVFAALCIIRIVFEASRSSTTYFGNVTYYGYELDTHLMVLSVIGAILLLWLGIRAVRRRTTDAVPGTPGVAPAGGGHPVPKQVLIVAAVIFIAIIGFAIASPYILKNPTSATDSGLTATGNDYTFSPTTLATTVTTMPPTSSPSTRTVATPIITAGPGETILTSSLPAPPVSAFSGDPLSGMAPLQVQFTDRSTGQPTVWQWDFGDGFTSSERNPVHTYPEAGSYTVTLRAINSGGSGSARKSSYISVTSQQAVTTGQPAESQLISSFSYDRVSGPAPLTVQFTDTTTGGPKTAWYWKFGDGTTSYIQNPAHTYTAAGTYWPELTVTTTSGNAWSMSGPISVMPAVATTTVTVTAIPTVAGSAPQAFIAYDTDLGPAPLTVTFTDLSTGSPTSWSWDFGDGATSTTRNPVHTYTTGGSFYVRLIVGNSYGSGMIMQGPIEVFYRV